MVIEITVLKKQFEFIERTEQQVVFVGGVGSGKTWANIIHCMRACVNNPGIDVLYYCSTYRSLKDIVWQDFFKVCPRALISKSRIHRTTSTISFKNGSTIHLRAFDSSEKVRDATYGSVYVEELSTIAESTYRESLDCIRQTGMPNLFRATTIPPNKSHWIYEEFFENIDDTKKIVHASSFDNNKLPKEYLDRLESLKEEHPSYYNRMVMGNFGNIEGLIYCIDDNIIDFNKEQPKVNFLDCDSYIGLDFGHTNPCAILLVIVIGASYYVIDEVYKRKMTNDEIVDILKNYCNKYNIIDIVADSSDPKTIEWLENQDLPVVPSKKGVGSVHSGIIQCKNLFISKKLFIDRVNCKNLIKEAMSYSWNVDKNDKFGLEEPIKKDDHCMDALRYVMHHITLENRLDIEENIELFNLMNGFI